MDPGSFLSSCAGKSVLILTHSGADVDGFGGAAALYFALSGKAKPVIGIPEHINLNAKQLASSLKIPFTLNPKNTGRFGRMILTDFNSLSMLGGMAAEVKKFKGDVLLIDHHTKSGEKITGKEISLIDEDAVSSTELIYGILKEAKLPIGAKTAACIAAGIITDSANFLVADSRTFRVMSEAMKLSKKSYLDIVSLFSTSTDISEKVANLKAARRCRIFGSADYAIAVTDVGAFEASAAASLVKLGADVSFAGDADNGVVKISARANNQFVKDSGFDLPKDVFERLSKEFAGTGGGHSAAAGFTGHSDDVMAVLARCAQLTNDFIRKMKGNSAAQLKEYK